MNEAHGSGGWLNLLIEFGTTYLIPVMIGVFIGSIFLRGLVYYTIKREFWFSKEFEKRVNKFLSTKESSDHISFFVITKLLLEKTFYESFIMRSIMKRRRIDHIDGPVDRAFLIQHGSAWLVRDTLNQIRFLKWGNEHPKFLEISKSVYKNNACFNRLFGVLPISGLNDVLNILPGMFIIGGIFGTFLGIMKALPELSTMDVTNAEATKVVMDDFLIKISFSMSSSIIGIILSVTATIFNSLASPDKVFLHAVEKYELVLSNLWHRCDSNVSPAGKIDFDEHKDSFEALAEQSVRKELASMGSRFGDLEDDLDYGNEPKKSDAA